MKEKIKIVKYTIAGILFVGGLLDSLSNAIDFFTIKVSIWLSTVLLLGYVSFSLYLKIKKPKLSNNSNAKVTRLGKEANLFVLGVLIIIWIPRIFTGKQDKNCSDILSVFMLNHTKKEKLNEIFGLPLFEKANFYDSTSTIGIWKTEKLLIEAHFNTKKTYVTYFAIKLLQNSCLNTFKESLVIGESSLSDVKTDKISTIWGEEGSKMIPNNTYLTWDKSDTYRNSLVYKYYFDNITMDSLIFIIGYHDNSQMDNSNEFARWLEISRDDKTLTTNTLILENLNNACIGEHCYIPFDGYYANIK